MGISSFCGQFPRDSSLLGISGAAIVQKKKPVQRCPSLFGAEIRQRFVQSQWVFLYTNYIFNNACEWTIPNPPNFGSLNHFGPKKLQGGTHVSPFFTQKMSQIPRSLKEQDRKTSGTPGQVDMTSSDPLKKPPNRNVREECFPVFFSRGNPGGWSDVYLLTSLVYY